MVLCGRGHRDDGRARSATGAAASRPRPLRRAAAPQAARSGRGSSRLRSSRPRTVAGWYVYMQIQDQLKSNQPIAVENYVGLHESDAVCKITERGLTPNVVRRPNDVQPTTIVYDQDPAPGNRIDKGNMVTIFVSTGKPKVVVPDVARQELGRRGAGAGDAGLKSTLLTVPSSQPTGTVVAQHPKAGSKVVEGHHSCTSTSRRARRRSACRSSSASSSTRRQRNSRGRASPSRARTSSRASRRAR